MYLFYTQDITDGIYKLNAEESHHCTRVLRLKQGDTIHLTDGAGRLFEAEISMPERDGCILNIVKTTENYGKRNFFLHLAVAPTKNSARFEWFLEKATEIGVDRITPLICNHAERISVKTERLKRLMVGAMKQSLKAYLPCLDEPLDFTRFVETCGVEQRFIAHCSGGEMPHLKNAYTIGKDAVILIGPEGDFSPDEVAKALQKGYKPVNLGESRLRTETAALAACHTINLMND